MGRSVYRKKICPVCGIEHRKRGPFCCASHAAQRPASEEKKAKISKTMLEYYTTPEGLQTTHNLILRNGRKIINNQRRANGEYVLTPDDWALDFSLHYEDEDDIINW